MPFFLFKDRIDSPRCGHDRCVSKLLLEDLYGRRIQIPHARAIPAFVCPFCLVWHQQQFGFPLLLSKPIACCGSWRPLQGAFRAGGEERQGPSTTALSEVRAWGWRTTCLNFPLQPICPRQTSLAKTGRQLLFRIRSRNKRSCLSLLAEVGVTEGV